MEKKSTSLAIISAVMAADGTSIMAPTNIFGLNGTFFLLSSSLASSIMFFAVLSSSTPDIMGNITLMLPKTLALKIPLSCVLNISGSLIQNLIALSPIAGFISGASSIWERNLSPPISSVRMIVGWGVTFSATFLYTSKCSSSEGRVFLLRYINSVL